MRLFAGLAAVLILGGGLFVSAAASPASHARAPRVTSAATLAQLPTPLPYPYDPAAPAAADVAAARAKAKASGRLLIIDLGGNWCADCRILAGVMELPEVHRWVEARYVVVAVDVGRFDRNMNIPGRYGITRLEGVPALLVIDPRHDTLLNRGRTSALADARSMSPQSLADWLALWTPK